MDWKQLKELIELVSEKGFSEFEIERQGFRLRISNLLGQHPPAGAYSPAAPQGILTPTAAETRGAPLEQRAATPDTALPVALSRTPSPSVERAAQSSLQIIKSPIVGTFYRSPSPNSEPFVKVGDFVEQDSVICIIEAMKLMNEIQAEVRGEIAEIYVENAQAVEFGEPLFGVRL